MPSSARSWRRWRRLRMAVHSSQKQFFAENGYLLLERLYSPYEVAEARAEMERLLRDPQSAHPRVRFSYEEADGTPAPPDNPNRVWMMMDTPLAGDWWFRQICEPRVVDAMADCLGPNLDFHNGKARIKPPGYRSH